MNKSINLNKSLSLLLLIIALLVVLLPQLYLNSFKTDDAYITFRYATRLANGLGLTFNPGEHVEGFSNPLWTLLIAGFVRLFHFDAPLIAHILGLLFSIGTILRIWLLFCNNPKAPYFGLANFTICMAIILSNPGFHIYATAGLEGPLLMFLITSGVVFSLKHKKSTLILAAIIFSLIGITRPEGLLYALLWYLFAIWFTDKKVIPNPFKFVIFAILLLPFIFYEFFRFFYFGSLIPNTGFAKPPGVFGSGIIALLIYLSPWIFSVITIMTLFILKRKQSTDFVSLLRTSIGPIMASVIFVIYAQGDWMPFGRFITPIWPIVAIVLTVWIHLIIEYLNENQILRIYQLSKLIIAIVFIASSLSAWESQIMAYLRNEKMNMLMKGTDQLVVGEWLNKNVKKGTTVATGRLGGISYNAPDLIFWDTSGLTDKEEAKFVNQNRPGGFTKDPIWNRFPELIAAVDVPTTWSYTQNKEFYDWTKTHYSFVRSFPQGNYGSFDIWVRNDVSSIIFLPK